MKLDDKDKELFFFDMDSVDWSLFFKESILGIRKYLMKEDPKTIPQAVQRLQRFVIYRIFLKNNFTRINHFILYLISD